MNLTRLPSPGGTDVTDPPKTGRLYGVDAVRALAVVGVFVEHFYASGWVHGVPLGPGAHVPGFLDWLNQNTSSRAMSLFVLLLGVSTALMSGGATPHGGRELSVTRRRLAVRALALFLISLCIDMYGSSVIEYYAVLLLLVLPLLRLRARTLFAASAVSVPVVTLFSFWVLNQHSSWMMLDVPNGLAMLVHPGQWGASLLSLTLTGGGFQTVYGLPFVLAGLAIGRLDLRSRAVQAQLMLTGAAVAVCSALVSWVATYPLGGIDAAAEVRPPGMGWQALLAMPTDSVTLYATSPFGIVLMIGVGLFLLGGMQWLASRPGGGRVLWPLAAAGSMAFTWYAVHFAVQDLVPKPYSFVFLAAAVAVMFVVSVAWRHWLRRGPLEWLVNQVITGLVRTRARAGAV